MNFASSDWHDKCRKYLENHMGTMVIDNNGDHIIGANIAASCELTLYDPDSCMKRVIGKPDIVLFNRRGEPEFTIEYKSGTNQKRKAVHQLNNNFEFIHRTWQHRSRLLYSTGTPNGGYTLEEIIK